MSVKAKKRKKAAILTSTALIVGASTAGAIFATKGAEKSSEAVIEEEITEKSEEQANNEDENNKKLKGKNKEQERPVPEPDIANTLDVENEIIENTQKNQTAEIELSENEIIKDPVLLDNNNDENSSTIIQNMVEENTNPETNRIETGINNKEPKNTKKSLSQEIKLTNLGIINESTNLMTHDDIVAKLKEKLKVQIDTQQISILEVSNTQAKVIAKQNSKDYEGEVIMTYDGRLLIDNIITDKNIGTVETNGEQFVYGMIKDKLEKKYPNLDTNELFIVSCEPEKTSFFAPASSQKYRNSTTYDEKNKKIINYTEITYNLDTKRDLAQWSTKAQNNQNPNVTIYTDEKSISEIAADQLKTKILDAIKFQLYTDELEITTMGKIKNIDINRAIWVILSPKEGSTHFKNDAEIYVGINNEFDFTSIIKSQLM